jgi:hypothetical protein
VRYLYSPEDGGYEPEPHDCADYGCRGCSHCVDALAQARGRRADDAGDAAAGDAAACEVELEVTPPPSPSY